MTPPRSFGSVYCPWWFNRSTLLVSTVFNQPVAAGPDTPHVRHVEAADPVAYRRVFLEYATARVLQRHVPPAETDHFCTKLYMFFEKRSLSEG
jgi:hypothetical protein